MGYESTESAPRQPDDVATFATDSWIGRSLPDDAAYMRRAIALAHRGEGWCHPNPMVGAVIVKNGVIIGEGYHARCGQLHAERNAIASLREPADGSTLYVTLEPCCHYGRTPPCTEALIENHIARVIIGSRDPNPKVHGKGAATLREHGIEVHEDFLRDECDELNPVFFHYITTHTPYVRMKYAMTLDGKTATRTGASKWITGEESRRYVHFLRHTSMGIMVGIGTALADDPLLTCRIDGGRNPTRIVCDSTLRLPVDSQLVKTAHDVPTIVACAPGADDTRRTALESHGVEVLECPVSDDGGIDLATLMRLLGDREIDSVLLEGGGTLNASALEAGIVDEVDCFVAPQIFGASPHTPVSGSGVATPSGSAKFTTVDVRRFGNDVMLRCIASPANPTGQANAGRAEPSGATQSDTTQSREA